MDVRVYSSGDHGGGDAWFWQDHGFGAPFPTQLYQLSGKVDVAREHSLPQTALNVFKAKPTQPGKRLLPGHPDLQRQLLAFDAHRTSVYLSAYGFDDFAFSGLALICSIRP